MAAIEARLSDELVALKRAGRYRQLTTSSGLDFTSNDFLGFARDDALQKRALELAMDLPTSSSGSRLLRGNHPLHEQAELRFASLIETPRALLFNSGYDANLALLSALPSRHATIYYDANVHASIKEGIRASLASKQSFRHNKLEHLEALLFHTPSDSEKYIVVESVYSMEGDEAPLHEIVRVAQLHGALVIVDEAHATGVFGPRGSGLVNELGLRTEIFATIHTCGKALASQGAFICGSQTLIAYLINKARPFLFSTALPPSIPAQLLATIDRLEVGDGSARAAEVLQQAQYLRNELIGRLERWQVPDGRSPIVPVLIGEDDEAVRASTFLIERGFDVRAIRPPTVATGSARLRIVVQFGASKETLSKLAWAVQQAEIAITT